MFAKDRRTSLRALLLAALIAAPVAAACAIIRPNSAGYGIALAGGMVLFVVLFLVLVNAGWRFGVWFRLTPESPPVFVKMKRHHPLGCVVLLWIALAAVLGFLGIGMFGPHVQSWSVQQLYPDFPAEQAPVSPASRPAVFLQPLDSFPAAAVHRLASRLRKNAPADLTVMVLPALRTGLKPVEKTGALSLDALSAVIRATYSRSVSSHPDHLEPMLICISDQITYSEAEQQEMMYTRLNGLPAVIISTIPFTTELPDDINKARVLFETRLAKITKRTLWWVWRNRAFHDGTGDIYGESPESNQDLDARPDDPLPY